MYEDDMICDLAETYGIYDYRGLPPNKVAVLVTGLRDNSRLKLHGSKTGLTLEDNLLIGIVDRLSILIWQNSKAAQDGADPPELIMDTINNSNSEKKAQGYESGEDFKAARERIIKGATS